MNLSDLVRIRVFEGIKPSAFNIRYDFPLVKIFLEEM